MTRNQTVDKLVKCSNLWLRTSCSTFLIIKTSWLAHCMISAKTNQRWQHRLMTLMEQVNDTFSSSVEFWPWRCVIWAVLLNVSVMVSCWRSCPYKELREMPIKTVLNYLTHGKTKSPMFASNSQERYTF